MSMTMSIRRKRLDMSDNALPKVMTTMYRPFHTCAHEAQHQQHPKRPNDTQEGQVEAEAAYEEHLENPYGHSHVHEGIPAVAPVSYAAEAVKLRQHIDDEDQIEDVRSRYDTVAPSMASSSDSATEFEAFCSIDASLDASLDAA